MYRAGRSTDEQDVAVALELRALVAGQGVLDGERVQRELVGDLSDLLGRRAEEPDPGHAVLIARVLEGLVEARRILDPLSGDVHAVVDQWAH